MPTKFQDHDQVEKIAIKNRQKQIEKQLKITSCHLFCSKQIE